MCWKVVAIAAALGCVRPVSFGDDRGPPNPSLAQLPANGVLDLGRYQCDMVVDPCEHILDWGSFVYDGRGRQLLIFGGEFYLARRTDVSAFDLNALTWQSAYPPTPCADMTPANLDTEHGAWRSTGHPVTRQVDDMLAMDERSGDMVMLAPSEVPRACTPDVVFPKQSSSVAHYHPDTRVWEYTAPMAGAWPAHAAVEYDPVSGRIVVLSNVGLWTYDPSAHSVEKHMDQQRLKDVALPYGSQLLYFPPNRRMYHIAKDFTVAELVLDRADWAASTITAIAIGGAPPEPKAKGWAYDARHKVIGGGVRDGLFFTLDPVARRWQRETMKLAPGQSVPPGTANYTLAYDPVNDVFIFTNDYGDGHSAWHTWVYRRQ
jgi:hypothetical protein